MCLPVSLPKYKYVPNKDNPLLDTTQIDRLFKQLTQQVALKNDVTAALKKAILDPKDIGPALDISGGSLHNRIQRWLWKNYDFKFYPKKGQKRDSLEDIIQKIREDTVEYPIEVELSKTMDWDGGDFGDDGSCYFSSNSVTRRYLNGLDKFRAVKVYKDGKGFGRALMLGGINEKDYFIMYNTYPGHRELKHHSHFAAGLKAALENGLQKEFYTKMVRFENKSPESWFYTNGNTGTLFCPIELAEEAEKETGFVISLGKRPIERDLAGFIGLCASCNYGVFDYDKGYWKLNDDETDPPLICKRCNSKHTQRCHVTDTKGPTINADIAKKTTKYLDKVLVPARLKDGNIRYVILETLRKDKTLTIYS